MPSRPTRTCRLLVACLVAAGWVAVPLSGRAAEALAGEATALDPDDEPLRPIPTRAGFDPATLRLGYRLFHDRRLSRDGSVACASCHDVASGGADGRRRSIGIDGGEGEVNAPSVLNAAFNFRQFWDGRAETLESQVDGPLQHPAEMGSSWPEVIARLNAAPEYAAAFAEVAPAGITPDVVRGAIATYERWLATFEAPFDRYLRGEPEAISAEAAQGYELFKAYGCVSCHQGVGVGGNMFQVFGIMGDYFASRGELTDADLGRFNLTGDPADRHVFKVPSLRNVAVTAPYFHDGSVDRLENAVGIMATYQLGRTLSPGDIDRIVRFLETLTAEVNPGEP